MLFRSSSEMERSDRYPIEPNAADPLLAPVTVRLEQVGTRGARLTLTVGSLKPCVENMPNCPLGASPELVASYTAGMLARATESAAADGNVQDYRKRQQDEEAKQRAEAAS